MQPIRTVSEIEFEFHVFTQEAFVFQDIASRAKQLHRLGMNFHQIGKALGVDEKTVKKAVLDTCCN